MEPWVIWVVGGMLLLLAELLLPGIFLFWVGLAAIATGLMLTLAAFSTSGAMLVFLACFAVAIALGMRFRRPFPSATVNTPGSGLAGRHGILLEPGQTGDPRVRVGDSDWAARLPRDAAGTPPGTPVRVEGVDGTTLVVRPLD